MVNTTVVIQLRTLGENDITCKSAFGMGLSVMTVQAFEYQLQREVLSIAPRRDGRSNTHVHPSGNSEKRQ